MKKELFVLLVPLFLGCSSVPEEFVMEFPNTRDWAGGREITWRHGWETGGRGRRPAFLGCRANASSP